MKMINSDGSTCFCKQCCFEALGSTEIEETSAEYVRVTAEESYAAGWTERSGRPAPGTPEAVVLIEQEHEDLDVRSSGSAASLQAARESVEQRVQLRAAQLATGGYRPIGR